MYMRGYNTPRIAALEVEGYQISTPIPQVLQRCHALILLCIAPHSSDHASSWPQHV